MMYYGRQKSKKTKLIPLQMESLSLDEAQPTSSTPAYLAGAVATLTCLPRPAATPGTRPGALPTEVLAKPTATVFDYLLAALFKAREALSCVSIFARTISCKTPLAQGPKTANRDAPDQGGNPVGLTSAPHQGRDPIWLTNAARKALREASEQVDHFVWAFTNWPVSDLQPWADGSHLSRLADSIRVDAAHACVAARRAVRGLDRTDRLHPGPFARQLGQFATEAAWAVDRHVDAVYAAVTWVRDDDGAHWFPTFRPAVGATMAARASRWVQPTSRRVRDLAHRPWEL